MATPGHSLSLLLSILCLLLGLGHCVHPVVNLDYASYHGVQSTPNVTQWLGMRYAAPPLGHLRFQAPQKPLSSKIIRPADTFGKRCLQVNGHYEDPLASEDCLFLNVFAPSEAKETSRLPVFVYIQGGGFAKNSNPNINASRLIEASDGTVIVVTLNYRVGPYGFLSGVEAQRYGSLNNGLKDQRMALEWVKENIRMFGGNPKHVVVGGNSAGALSTVLQLAAYGGRNDDFIKGVIVGSVSHPPMYTSRQNQFIYDQLAERTGCSGRNSFRCLQDLSARDLQLANKVAAYEGMKSDPLFLYVPTIDHDMIRDSAYEIFKQGNFLAVPSLVGDDANGGTTFGPRSAISYDDSNDFLRSNFPDLSTNHLKDINRLYWKDDFTETFPMTGSFFRLTSQVFGDMRFLCPSQAISTAFSRAGQESYHYLYAVEDPSAAALGFGVPHTVELYALFGPENVDLGDLVASSYFPGGVNEDIIDKIQTYWLNFIKTLNPNPSGPSSLRYWEPWNPKRFNRLFIQGHSLKMAPPSLQEKRRCSYLEMIGPSLHQ